MGGKILYFLEQQSEVEGSFHLDSDKSMSFQDQYLALEESLNS